MVQRSSKQTVASLENEARLDSGGSSGSLHNFGNDYNDYFLRSGVLPQCHIMNAEDPLTGYPRLQKLHVLKRAHTERYAGKAFGRNVEPSLMRQELLTWASQSLNFDVIMIGGCIDQYPSLQMLMDLPVQKLTPRPSIVFLWVPGPGLEAGRRALEHWGFRRSEDIVYFVTNKGSLHYPHAPASGEHEDCIVKSTWHCLMGLKGTLRRSEDSDLINCNVDTDVILEKPTERPNVIPESMYEIVENFTLMSRRLHIIPGHSTIDKPVRPRKGWVIMSPDVLLDNFEGTEFNSQTARYGHRVPVDSEIDSLRPKTPTKARKR